jgi:hypothetical protein
MSFKIDHAFIDEAKESIAHAKRVLRIKVEATLMSAFNELFERYPHFHSLVWTQYTPYFNDGDECVFMLHGGNFHVDENWAPNAAKKYHTSGRDVALSTWSVGHYSKDEVTSEWFEFVNELNEIWKFIESNEEYLEMIWGDHVEVTVDRNGFSTEEYEHD